MDLPTYTNIWRIEKRLYKLYDLRLPMPLPLVQIGVFIGVFLPWIVLLQVVGLPFHAPWHVVYLVPPGVLTWLATRPVIEGKRLTELLISQVRYLTEARTWARLTPIREPAEVAIVGRVWRRGRLSGARVHAAQPVPEPVVFQGLPERAAASPPPAVPQRVGAAAEQGRNGAAPRRTTVPQRPPAPSLQATPHDGTAAIPPAAPGGRRPEPVLPATVRPQITRPEQTVRPDVPRPRPTRPGPTAPQTVPALSTTPDMPAARTAGRDATDGALPGAGRPQPASAGGPAPAEREAAEGALPDANRSQPAETPIRPPSPPRRVTRQRSISHEPDTPAASMSSPPTLGRPSTTPPAKPAESTVESRADAPTAPAGSSVAAGRPAAPPQPPSARPGTDPAAGAGERQKQRPGTPPARPGPTGGHGDDPERSARPSGPPGRAGQGTPPAPAPLPHGRHAKPADEPSAASPPAGSRAGDDRPEHRPGGHAPERPAAVGPAMPSDEQQAIAEARTDQVVWPTNPRRTPTAEPDTPARTARDAAGGTTRPKPNTRGRSHGEETASRETRPSASSPAARDAQSPAQGWTPPAPRPAVPGRPATPPAPPAGRTPSRAVPPQVPQPAAPAQPSRAQPARPGRPPSTRAVRPASPPRQGGDQQTWPAPHHEDGGAPAESPARAVRSGPASPVRPGPMPQPGHDDDARGDDGRERRRIFSGGGHGDGDYEERVRTAFAGARRVVVLGCTGGAGQTVTALMLGHTFAQHRGDRIVAVDVNPGPGAMARRTRSESRETLTSLITHAEQVTGYQMMRRYTSVAKSGLEVVAAGKNPVQALDDRDYALAMRTLDRFYSITLLDAAAAVVARVLPYADQIVLVAPASSDAPRAVAMTFEWLDGHGYEDLRARAVTVINGVSRRSMDDVEHAESVARGRCRALVRIPWDDHLSLDRAPRNELRSLRSPTRKAYIALGGVVAGGLVQTPGRYPQQEVSR